MKLGVIVFLSFIAAGCNSFGQSQSVAQESYFVPVIRSDVSSSGYTPTVTPIVKQTKETPRIYTPVLR
ncbi:hypothetical protein [Marinomonas colpomeniae]|uniref:Lipoprotein n=1 Tax=Marinomonas colpomeniae TaxID=2774408 RepID=A0ABR8P4L4_9GAMM|nr:hypothetical protein [Marinomonas colpomeniae]MBD5772262.1 hypothetical protein [Marinomonas colpomeniae]